MVMAGVARAEWRRHWSLVLACASGYAIVALPTMTLGAFMAPLEAEFGWTRAQVTAGLIVQSLFAIVGQPLVGRMVDRWGARRVGLTGLVLSGCALVGLSFADGSVFTWLLLWLFVAIVTQLIYPPVWAAAVSSEFEAGRGLALAITLSGGNIVTLAAPVLATMLIENQGWRAAYVILGLVPVAIVLIPCYFFLYSRQDRERLSQNRADTPVAEGVTAQDGLRSPVFYKLLLATLIGNPLVIGMIIHAIPILSTTGLSREQAALAAGSLGLSAILGRMICGVLVTRVPGHILAAAMMLLPIGAALMLMTPSESVPLRILALTFAGMSSGAQMKMSIYLASRHFGMRAFGTLIGFISMIFTVATGAGPFIAGYLFDLTGDYRLMLTLAIPLSVIASMILLWVGRYPDSSEEGVGQAGLAARSATADLS
jgi:MFS family permease